MASFSDFGLLWGNADLRAGCPASQLCVPPASAANTTDAITRATRTYLSSPQIAANHLPHSWWSPALSGGDYANPAEIGLYALAWLAAYDLGRLWKGPANVPAGNEPLTYRIAIASVGKPSRALLEIYRKAVQNCSPDWPGIEFLSDDIQMCDEISITRAP